MSELELDRAALLQSFLDESSEGLDEMEQALLGLEARADDAEAVRAVFRIAHTLKGNAMMLGLTALGGFAHSIEDLLDRVRGGKVEVTPPLINALLRAVDSLRQLVPAAAAGTHTLSAADESLQREFSDAARLGAAAPAAPAEAGPLRFEGARRSLRVDVEKLDRLVALAGEMAVARVRLGQMLAGGRPAAEALDLHHDIDRMGRELYERMMALRAVRLSAALRTQERTVRDAATVTGKQARVLIAGEEVEADTSVVDGIRDALAHMVRNAVAHGLESPAERRAAGKDPCGTVRLSAAHESGTLVIRVEDDGRGLDRAKLREEARRRGLPETLDEAGLFELVFEPGFSTAAEVTGLAGRGVGLDVVRRAVETLRGTISVESEPGKGTRFVLRLPLALSIRDGLPVVAGENTYLMPLENVLECLDLTPEGPRVDEGGVVDLRGTALPFLRLRKVLGVEAAPPARECLVVVQQGRRRAGLVVDALHGGVQVAVRPLGSLLRGAFCLSGSALLGTGKVALMLDVEALLSRAFRGNLEPVSPGAPT